MICGQILGDLGADVIAIEPPGGAAARRRGPFYRDAPHPDRSLNWWAYSRNKRSMTLDVSTPEGQATAPYGNLSPDTYAPLLVVRVVVLIAAFRRA